MPSSRTQYEPVDAAMLRATTATGTLLPALPWPDLSQDNGIEEACRWITEAWADLQVAEGVTVASPALAQAINELCAGRHPKPPQVRRTLLALTRYLLRMRGRATPFGLFAGVTALRWGEARARWEPNRHRVRTRAHSVWLALVIAELETYHELFRALTVVVNDAAFERGERLIVPWQPHATDPSRPRATEVSLRLTTALQLVLTHARTPLAVTDLTEKITAEAAARPDDVVELLGQLVSAGVLVSSLRPPSTCSDGLAYLRERLAEAGAATIADLRPMLAELEQVAAGLAVGRIETGTRMRELAQVDHPVTVDLHIGATVVLPPQVAAEAAAAASALMRLAPHPGGHPGWRAYHEAFLTRYGLNAVVPLSLLVDPVAGIGYPRHFTESAEDFPRELTGRDKRLLALAQRAALDGARQVVLDDAFIGSVHDEGLSGSQADVRFPPHLELFSQLWAPTLASITNGDFLLVVSGVARTGVALSGRFVDLLPEQDQRHRRDLYAGLPTIVEGAVAAQLSYPPIHPHLENVVRAPQLLPVLVTVAEHRPFTGDRFPLEDLAVTADGRGMYLISLSRRQVVEPMLANAGARHVMPAMARLLFEIPRARIASSSPFAWGAARCLPFLPRIVYGRAVLSLARWAISPDALPEPGLPDARWQEKFEALRNRLGLPATISIGDSDLRLRLNLNEPADLAVLRDHFEQARSAGKTVVLAEGATPADHGWFEGRASELVIPVASTQAPAPAPRALARPGRLAVIRSDRGVLPGAGRLLMAKLYTDPLVFDTILLRHVPDLLNHWPQPPQWWFVRYSDPDPHLRLRIHTDAQPDEGTGDGRETFARVSAWAARLRDHGLLGTVTFDTHLPETARYGGGETHLTAERLFAADSAVALAQLAVCDADRTLPRQALAAAGTAHLVAGLTGGIDAGMRWLIDYGDPRPSSGSSSRPARDVVRRAVQLTEPGAITTLPRGRKLAQAWAQRAATAAVYRDHLDGSQLDAVGTVRSLLHMNHIRCVGIDPDSERTCRRIARAIALAWTSRAPVGRP